MIKSLFEESLERCQRIIQTCTVCQTTNDAKFAKQFASLHPIPVKPEVWRQVANYVIANVVSCIMKFFFQVGACIIT